MDKAKRLAEQAQEKLDEQQTKLNERGAGGGAPSDGPVVEYDAHGRPIRTEASTPPPAPTATTASEPQGSAPPVAPAPPPSAPLQPAVRDEYAPPAVSSGDPLAG